MENCVSPCARIRTAQFVTQSLVTEPNTPGIKLANVLESRIVGSSHPVLRNMHGTPGCLVLMFPGLLLHVDYLCLRLATTQQVQGITSGEAGH